MAQQNTGNIYGKIVDVDGMPLPGVSVSCTGKLTAPLSFTTTAQGTFRFLRLSPSNDYTIKAALEGFNTEIRENIIINTGVNIDMVLIMTVGSLSEEVTVTAVTPMVDTKKTDVAQVVTRDVLQSLPSARDPWVVLQMAPGIAIDRENVSGSQSGQQSHFAARGTGDQHQWQIDGIVYSSEANQAGSYWDFDSFEEMQLTVGGMDIALQTAGIAINIVTRRGGNKLSLQGRFLLSDNYFQSEISPEQLADLGIGGYNKIRQNRDYGFNLGFPIIRDKLWFYGAWGTQDLKNDNIYGNPNDYLLTTNIAKVNAQIIPQNRFEIFAQGSQKQAWGKGYSASLPRGKYQGPVYYWGMPTVKIQDEHSFGDNLLISLKYVHNNAANYLTPLMDMEFENVAYWNVADQLWEGGQNRYWITNPLHHYLLTADYFNENFLGASHAMKFGAEVVSMRANQEPSIYPGNFIVNRNYNTTTVDYDGDGHPDIYPGINRIDVSRGRVLNLANRNMAAYFQDTITFGRMNIIAGLRYDYQVPEIKPFSVKGLDTDNPAPGNFFTQDAINAIQNLLPAVDIPGFQATASDGSDYSWKFLSPRVGITYDLFGDGKTIAKLFMGMYGNRLDPWGSSRWLPGGTSGYMNFWWKDNNGDGKAGLPELYWHNSSDYGLYNTFDGSGNFAGNLSDASGIMWGSFDPTNPLQTTDPYTLTDKSVGPLRTTEIMFSVQRELFEDVSVDVNFIYRKYDKFNWSLTYYPDTDQLQSKDWYMSAGRPPASVGGFSTGDAANHDWYVLKPGYNYTPWSFVKPRPDYYQDYYGMDLVFNKRLSNKWMMNGSLTLQTQSQHFGDNGYVDPTNLWALDGETYDTTFFTRWMLKLGGLYQLPYDINVSFNLRAREGWGVLEYFTITDSSLPNPRSRSSRIYTKPYGEERLGSLFDLSLRLEKMLMVGDVGRIFLIADVFNALNTHTINRRYDKNLGTYDVVSGIFSPYALNFGAKEILSPRILRLGVRFNF